MAGEESERDLLAGDSQHSSSLQVQAAPANHEDEEANVMEDMNESVWLAWVIVVSGLMDAPVAEGGDGADADKGRSWTANPAALGRFNVALSMPC
jgi:hypothetical protein